MMQQFKHIDQISIMWNVNPLTVERWCIDKKIDTLYIDNTWLINSEQQCPLLTFEEHLVYLIDNAANEFNELGASLIYYNEIYVYTDLNPEGNVNEDAIILTKDITTRINYNDLAKLCYIHYLFDYKHETGCYPIFFKDPTLKTLMF